MAPRARALPLCRIGMENDMRSDDLQFLYTILRRELEAAYAVRPWDGERIDRIAAELLKLERSLAVHAGRGSPHDRAGLGPRTLPAWRARSFAPALPPQAAQGTAPNDRVRRR